MESDLSRARSTSQRIASDVCACAIAWMMLPRISSSWLREKSSRRNRMSSASRCVWPNQKMAWVRAWPDFRVGGDAAKGRIRALVMRLGEGEDRFAKDVVVGGVRGDGVERGDRAARVDL